MMVIVRVINDRMFSLCERSDHNKRYQSHQGF